MAASESPRIRLLHIRDEIDRVTAAFVGIPFAIFTESYTLRRVTERALQIISEAARSLPASLISEYPAAPWNPIIGLGNILRHEYQYVYDRRLWEIVTVHLPGLRQVVVEMLDDRSDPSS